MHPLFSAALGLAAGVAISFAAFGSKPDHDGQPHVDLIGSTENATDATLAYRAAASRLRDALQLVYDENPDADFAATMIPINQAAIEVAEAALAHGTDSDLRILASEVVNEQRAQMSAFQEWLAEQDTTE